VMNSRRFITDHHKREHYPLNECLGRPLIALNPIAMHSRVSGTHRGVLD
jgi:hypothetical protein